MNLHGMAAAAIAAVNPMQTVIRKVSTGNVVNADGTVTPSYAFPDTLQGQVQALSSTDLRQSDNITLQSIAKTVYLCGATDAIERPLAKGGDLLTIGTSNWLVVRVLEEWPDWSRVLVTLQDDAP